MLFRHSMYLKETSYQQLKCSCLLPMIRAIKQPNSPSPMNMRLPKFLSATVSLCSLIALNVSAQTPIVLFQDGFENSVTGAPPATTDPAVGSYLMSGTNANNLVVVSGPTEGGPDGAIEGTNYLRYDRKNFGGSPLLHCLFASSLFATNTPFHASFYKWVPQVAGDYPQMVLGTGTSVNGLVQLVYTTDWPDTRNWRVVRWRSHRHVTLFYLKSLGFL